MFKRYFIAGINMKSYLNTINMTLNIFKFHNLSCFALESGLKIVIKLI